MPVTYQLYKIYEIIFSLFKEKVCHYLSSDMGGRGTIKKVTNVVKVTYVYVWEKYNSFPNSKSIFMISNFKIFPIMLLRPLKFGVLTV